MKNIIKSAGLVLLATLPLLVACNGKENPNEGKKEEEQKTEAAVIKAAEREISVDYTADEKTIAIEQNKGFDASVTSGAEWLSVTTAADYKSITLKYSENEGDVRAGEVTLTKENAMWKFTVTQAAAPAQANDKDIKVNFTLAGEMPDMGMKVYALAADDLKIIPEGRIVILQFKTMNGQVRLLDSNNEALLYREITPDLTVAFSWDAFAESMAAGGRILIIGEGALENEIKGIYVTRDEAIPFQLQGQMPDMGMSVYAVGEGAFKNVSYGDIVVLKFKTSGAEGDQVRLMDGSNQALLYRGITPDGTIAFNFNKDEIEGNVVDMATISRILIIGAGALENELVSITYAHVPEEE